MSKQDKVDIFWALFSVGLAFLIYFNNDMQLPKDGFYLYAYWTQLCLFAFRLFKVLDRNGLS